MPRPSQQTIVLAAAAVLAIVLLALFLADPGNFLAELPKLMQMAFLVLILVFVGVGLWSEGAFGRAVRYSLSWVIIGVVLYAGYDNRGALQLIAQRFLADLTQPVAAVQPAGDGEGGRVLVERAPGAQFRVPTVVNGVRTVMLFDTGASLVTLTHADAMAAGIDTDGLRFAVPILTANGRTTAAPIVIGRLAVGSIERRNIRALVAREGTLENSLLGLSFLDRLPHYSVVGDRLELTP